jgi:LPXTG-site transpeptidase (sortase) family protein
MNNDDKQSGGFGASLPLPVSGPGEPGSNEKSEQELAADLVRRKVAAAYSGEPDVAEEAQNLKAAGDNLIPSKHQQFIEQLTASGKTLQQIQTAWHEYYAGLTDVEKHEAWQEFYSAHAAASSFKSAVPSIAPARPEPLKKLRDQPAEPTRPDAKPARPLSAQDHLRSLLFGLAVGMIVLVIFLFSFFNERFIAPLIQPSRYVSGTPIINGGPALSDKPEIIIPKINVEVPVVYDVNTVNEADIDAALENGVVHYADTASPGQNGNLVIVGHSSNNIFNKGKYKFAFVLLSRLESGDTFYIQKGGKRYTYQVYDKKIVKPSDVSVLGTTPKPATATLITCDPPGTSINRLVVIGQQISPDIASNAPGPGQNTIATSTQIIPGNSPSLWSRLLHSL